MSDSNITKEAADSFKKAVSLIMPVTTEDLEMLLPFVQQKTVKKKDFILREGEICRNIFFLVNGFVRMYYTDFDGNEINYRFTDGGNFFVDFQSFLLQKTSRYYWQAMSDSGFLLLPHQHIQQIYRTSPVWNNFGRLMAEYVYLQLNERVDMLLFMSPEERYLYLLNKHPRLFEQVSQFHLSSYLGVKPESLSRIRKRLSGK